MQLNVEDVKAAGEDAPATVRRGRQRYNSDAKTYSINMQSP